MCDKKIEQLEKRIQGLEYRVATLQTTINIMQARENNRGYFTPIWSPVPEPNWYTITCRGTPNNDVL